MVVVAFYYSAAANRCFNCFIREFGNCSFYLHHFLGGRFMDRIEEIKTGSTLSLAFLIGYFLFNVELLLWIAAILLVGVVFESRINTLIAGYWMKFTGLI